MTTKKKKTKQRLDRLLTVRGLFPSRHQAQAAIMAGLVFVAGQKGEKAGQPVDPDVAVEIKGELHPFVGRGGVKLAAALAKFNVAVSNKICLDVGASTGGFTDCLLQNGAAKVYAIDVGYGQLEWKLRQDPRVAVIERTNVRYLTPEQLYSRAQSTEHGTPNTGKAEIAVIDVSFISLAKVLPAVYQLLADRAEVIALIKPQFEAGRQEVGKGGVVRDEAVREEVLRKVKKEAAELGFSIKGVIESPLEGADGNREYLMHLKK